MKKRLLLPFSLICLAGMIVSCDQLPIFGGESKDSQTHVSSSVEPDFSSPFSGESGHEGESSSSIPDVSSSSSIPEISSSIPEIPSSSSEEPIRYSVNFLNVDSLKEEWYVQDPGRSIAIECEPGVARTLIGKEIFVNSSDESVIKVENNTVLVAQKPGGATIYATYHDAIAAIRVTVAGYKRPIKDLKTIEEVDKGVAGGTISSSTDALDVIGIVTGLYGNTSIIQQGKYAMYVYNKNYTGIQVGDRAHLHSKYYTYGGLIETDGSSTGTDFVYEKYDDETEPETIIAENVTDMSTLKTEDASRLVNVSGLYSQGSSLVNSSCEAQASSSKYRVSFAKKGDYESYIFVNKYLPVDEIARINEKLNEAESKGMKIDVKNGHLYINTSYSSRFGISITSADQLTLSESDLIVKPTAVKLSADQTTISVGDQLTLASEFTPANTNRKGLTFTSSDKNIATVNSSGVVTAVGAGKVTITATSNVQGCENVKATIELTVKAAEFITNPVEGVSYYLGLNQATLGKKLYVNGEMNGYYFATVESKADAKVTKVEKNADGKYALKVGDKYAATVVSGNYVNVVYQEAAFYYDWDAVNASFFVDITNCGNANKNGKNYLGTSGSYNTVSSGVSQTFLVHLYPEQDVEPEPEPELPYETTPVDKASYYLALEQENLKKTLYMNGEMNGYYFATVEDQASAKMAVVEKNADGKYSLKIGEKYVATVVSGNYVNVVFQDDAFFYDFDAEKATFFVDITNCGNASKNGKNYLGTSGNYNTVSSGLSQTFFLRLYKPVEAEPELPYETTPVDKASYYLALEQENLKKTLYMNGEMNGYYFATVEDQASAKMAVVEKNADGKYSLKVGEKYVATVVSGNYVNVVFQDDAFFYDFDAEKATFFVDITNCGNASKNGKNYLGTSGNYNTVSSGLSQTFFLRLYKPVEAEPEPETPYVTNPVDKASYYLALEQENLSKRLYMNGEMNGYYFATVEDEANAKMAVVEKNSDGKYSLKIGEKYVATVVSGNYVNVVFQDDAFFYDFDAEQAAFFVDITNCGNASKNGKNYLGTSGNYNTVSSGVSQTFLLRLYGKNGEEGGGDPVVKPDYVTNPENNGVYILALNQETLGKKLYMTGEMNGYYFATSDSEANAAAVVAIKNADGKYALKVGEKYIATVVSGNHVNVVFQNEVFYYDFDAEQAAFFVDITNCGNASKNGKNYLGTSGNYNTVSSGVSQTFLLHLYEKSGEQGGEDPVIKPDYITNPEVTSSYILGLDQETLGKKLYMNGEMNGYYFATVENIADAKAVAIEKNADGKYALKINDKYIATVVSGNYVNVVFQNDVFYYDFDAEKAAFFVEITNCGNASKNGKNYLGTSGNFNTVSSGVSQTFLLHLYEKSGDETGGDPVIKPDYITTPENSGTYRLGLDQENLGKKLYMNGEMNGYYFATVEDIADSKQVVVTKNDDGKYALKINDKYIATVVSGNYVNVVFQNDIFYYDFDAEKAAFFVDITNCGNASKNGKNYLGTSGNYNTISSGVSQTFMLHLYAEPENGGTNPGGEEGGGDPIQAPETTLSVSVETLMAQRSYANSVQVKSFGLDAVENAVITVSTTGGGNSGKFYDSGKQWRIYQSENPVVTISASEGHTIVSVKITYAVNSGGTLVKDSQNIASATVVTVDAQSVSFTVGNTGTGTSGQVRITAFEVIYS